VTGRLIVIPAAARPYPGEHVVPVRQAGVSVPGTPAPVSGSGGDGPRPAGANGCTGTTRGGSACNGMAGPDGRCARHKED
jgi:hypothetical protein